MQPTSHVDVHHRRVERVTVVGGGYVGLTTAVWLSATGSAVTLVEQDETKVARLRAGRSPIFEQGVEELLQAGLDAETLRVGQDLRLALPQTDIVVVCVGTPSLTDGRADLGALNGVVATLRDEARDGTVMVIKSTVPPGTGVRAQRDFERAGRRIPVISCPEFLREGTAIEDLRTAARVVVGGEDAEAMERVAHLMTHGDPEVVLTDNTSAELIKYGSNAFLAVKISFINEMANLCDLVGGDVDAVARGMGTDPRIGRSFLNAGLGFGGSCFPKDTRALEFTAGRNGYSFWMLKSAIEVNERQRMRFVHRIRDAVGYQLEGRRVALLGLAFKPGTDDVRQAPAIDIALRLQELGAVVVAHDPVAIEMARGELTGVELVDDPYQALAGADIAALVTEWPEYRALDWARIRELMAGPVLVDGRNCLDAALLGDLGFNYHAIGRRPVVSHWSRRSVDRVVA